MGYGKGMLLQCNRIASYVWLDTVVGSWEAVAMKIQLFYFQGRVGFLSNAMLDGPTETVITNYPRVNKIVYCAGQAPNVSQLV